MLFLWKERLRGGKKIRKTIRQKAKCSLIWRKNGPKWHAMQLVQNSWVSYHVLQKQTHEEGNIIDVHGNFIKEIYQ